MFFRGTSSESELERRAEREKEEGNMEARKDLLDAILGTGDVSACNKENVAYEQRKK
jgi:hypothetical protein